MNSRVLYKLHITGLEERVYQLLTQAGESVLVLDRESESSGLLAEFHTVDCIIGM